MATVKISALTPLGALTDTSLVPVTSSGTTYSMTGSVMTSYLLNKLSITTASASGAGSLAFNTSSGVFTFTPAATYSLPTASNSTLGGVKVDGSTITINGSGVITANYTNYSLPTASTSVLGGVKVDGSTITINGSGVITANYTTYTLPTASNSTLGGVKVDGTSITISGGIISANAGSLAGSSLATGVTASSLTSVGTLTGLTVSGLASLGTSAAQGAATSGNFISNAVTTVSGYGGNYLAFGQYPSGSTLNSQSVGYGSWLQSGYSNASTPVYYPIVLNPLGGSVVIGSSLVVKDVRDTIYTGGSTTGTITPDCANGNVQTITLTGNITFNGFANAVAGQTLTMLITQPASGGPYTLTSTMKFAGGLKTLSTAANAVDLITVSYIGGTYYASLVTGYV